MPSVIPFFHHFATVTVTVTVTVTGAGASALLFDSDLVNDFGNTVGSAGHCDSSLLDGRVIDSS